MRRKKENYQHLLRLYSLVDEYLSDIPAKQENLPEIVVSFCIVTEKILKIKLHNENPVLVYENSKIKDVDALIAIIKNKELNIETIKIRETIARYKLMFDNDFSDNEVQVLIDIYDVRNHFVHGYKSDDDILSDRKNIIKKMGTVWEKISAQAISNFGKRSIKANKPKEKYSKEELEKVLIEEVRKKIKPDENNFYPSPFFTTNLNHCVSFVNDLDEICPRCGERGFSKNGRGNDSLRFAVTNVNLLNTPSDLFKCNKCNLELTEKEYEIAKKIKNEN
jgi:hypothetical protein